MPQTALTPAIRDVIGRLGRADIMVGIPSFKNAATIGYVVRAAQAGLVSGNHNPRGVTTTLRM